MGKRKKEGCDKPFLHNGPGKSFNFLNANSREKAKTVFPQVDWEKISIICVTCRLAINGGKTHHPINPDMLLQQSQLEPLQPASTLADTHRQTQNDETDAQPGPSRESNFPSDNAEMEIVQHEHELFSEPMEFDQNEFDFVSQDGNTQLLGASQSAAPSEADVYSQQSTQFSSGSTNSILPVDLQLLEINTILRAGSLEQIAKSDLCRPTKLDAVTKQLQTSFNEKLIAITGGKYRGMREEESCGFCDTLLMGLVLKYQDAKTMNEKYQILTSVPGRYNAADVMEKFGCSYYMALKAAQLRTNFGVLYSPSRKPGRKITDEVKALVHGFYLDSDNSRPSPRAADTIRVMSETGEYQRVAKYRLLHNLKDLHTLFQQKYQNRDDVTIGISKFAQLRPKQAVFPGLFGFHNTCLCQIHENFKFMYDALFTPINLKEFVATAICNPMRQECAYGLCEQCPIPEKFTEVFETVMELEEVEYKHWGRTDGTELNVKRVPQIQFMDSFKTEFTSYVQHSFIHHNQKSFFKFLKNDYLRCNKAIVVQVDFAQNYTFVIQNSVQGYHWTNKQATLHPFAVTYWNAEEGIECLKHYCVISDTMSHTADSFNTFKRKVIPKIIHDMGGNRPDCIIYISDGAGSQYKNWKNFAHLMEHHIDFGIKAEWHFCATSHGKCTCDAIAAVVKRALRLESLKSGRLINTARRMFDFCNTALKSDDLEFFYVSNEEVEADKQVYAERYRRYQNIPGTRKYHAFVPVENGIMSLRRTSSSETSHTFNFQKPPEVMIHCEDLTIGEFYAFIEADCIQVGMLVNKDDSENEFQCMKVIRATFALSWPIVPITHIVPTSHVLAQVSEPTSNNESSNLRLPPDEVKMLMEKFKVQRRRLQVREAE